MLAPSASIQTAWSLALVACKVAPSPHMTVLATFMCRLLECTYLPGGNTSHSPGASEFRARWIASVSSTESLPMAPKSATLRTRAGRVGTAGKALHALGVVDSAGGGGGLPSLGGGASDGGGAPKGGGVSELGGSATAVSGEPPPQLAVTSVADRHKENSKGLKRTGIEPLQNLPVASLSSSSAC